MGKKSNNNNKETSLQKSVLSVFVNNPFDAFNHKQVSARLGVRDKAGREHVVNYIYELLENGSIVEHKRGKFKLNKAQSAKLLPQHFVYGTVDMKQTGKAYVMVNDDAMDDIFIASSNTYHAMHGDKVKVFLFPMRKGRKLEGEIVEIVERSKTQLVGTLQISGRFAFVIPDSQNYPIDIFVPTDYLNNAQNGQKVIVKVQEWPERFKNPVGEIITVLGNPGDNNVEMMSILAEFDFPLSFPDEVEKAADLIPTEIPQKEIAARRDFRDVFTCTIDPADAKDFDDALSLQKLENGNYEIGVHIADVSYYVKPGSIIDEEAYRRATSVYLVDRTIPMLPERLCNGVCSLRPQEEKLCFSAVFEMNEKAEVVSKWFGRTVIKSDIRFAYEEAQEIIETKKGKAAKEILLMDKLAKILRKKRFSAGAINFNTVEVKFKLDEQARPIGVYVKESKEANHLIEEFMLLANKYVAEAVAKNDFSSTKEEFEIRKKDQNNKGKTFVYRVHDEPNPEKLTTFLQFVSKLGYSMKIENRKNLADSFNKLFKSVEGKGEANMVENIAIRTMAKAYYTTENIGHYGLGFPFYTHFTSPIRRYPDVMVHRLLDQYMGGKLSANKDEYEERCEHSSHMEKKAADAERMSVKYKQAEYLKDKIGQVFDGVISGVSKWGIFVELDDNHCEGMISLKTMDDDFYYLDDENYQVIGRSHKKTYKLGDKIRIRVKAVDMSRKRMDFLLE